MKQRRERETEMPMSLTGQLGVDGARTGRGAGGEASQQEEGLWQWVRGCGGEQWASTVTSSWGFCGKGEQRAGHELEGEQGARGAWGVGGLRMEWLQPCFLPLSCTKAVDTPPESVLSPTSLPTTPPSFIPPTRACTRSHLWQHPNCTWCARCSFYPQAEFLRIHYGSSGCVCSWGLGSPQR